MTDAANKGAQAGPELEALAVGAVLSRLKSDPEKGLSEDKVWARLSTYGPNALPESHASFGRLIFDTCLQSR